MLLGKIGTGVVAGVGAALLAELFGDPLTVVVGMVAGFATGVATLSVAPSSLRGALNTPAPGEVRRLPTGWVSAVTGKGQPTARSRAEGASRILCRVTHR